MTVSTTLRDRLIADISLLLGGAVTLPPRSYYLADTVDVARKMIGALFFRIAGSDGAEQDGHLVICGGKIVECEAYLGPQDPASHAATRSVTARNRIFYERGGIAYVYFSYGVHHCVNVVTGKEGIAGAVLIRALEPLVGIEQMARRRCASVRHERHNCDTKVTRDSLYALCSGPGKLCRALAITRAQNGCDLRQSELLLLKRRAAPAVEIATGKRIGISRAKDAPLRFWERGSVWVSR